MSLLWVEHQAGIVLFLLVLLVIVLSNLSRLRRISSYPDAKHLPRVSILVPARNEERNINPAVKSLLAQDYPDYEIIVLDDNSSDRTSAVVGKLAQNHKRLRFVRGEPLPEGWLGKPWACHQLAGLASGELLLFADADTRHEPQALRHAVNALTAEQADLVSAIPREVTGTLPEKLAVPFVTWSIIAFLPLRLAYRWRRPAFSAAAGQFMLFRREAYKQLGGYEAVRGSVVDDLAMARRAAKAGLRWRLLDAQGDVTCRMYESAGEVIEGFSKNLFPAFNCRLAPFTLVWLWLLVVTFQPLVILLISLAGLHVGTLSILMAAGAVLFEFGTWLAADLKFGFGWYAAFLYPMTIGLGVFVAARSVLLTRAGKARWKGRYLPRTRK